MDLDDKLREILDYCAETYYPMHEYPNQSSYTEPNKVTLDESVAAIKQAFTDAGYKPVIDLTPDTQIWAGKRLMTGQRWYDRFEKEAQGIDTDWEGWHKIAKKAAGLE